jgi:hypothetical protein
MATEFTHPRETPSAINGKSGEKLALLQPGSLSRHPLDIRTTHGTDIAVKRDESDSVTTSEGQEMGVDYLPMVQRLAHRRQ